MIGQVIKRVARRCVHSLGWEIHRRPSRSDDWTDSIAPGAEECRHSNLDEQLLVRNHLAALRVESGFCVDIGASDGLTMSNTYSLYGAGWAGLAVEYDPHKFAALARTYSGFSQVALAKCKVTPENVVALLEAAATPRQFGLLSLDIDGYDFFVLKQILVRYRPALICAEINEKIPPPLKFTVRWDPNYSWANDHFYGQSIAQLHALCVETGYALVELHYNNAFLCPREICLKESLTPEQAFRAGYLERPDRREKFPWNADVEALLNLPPDEAVKFIRHYFHKYEGQYELSL